MRAAALIDVLSDHMVTYLSRCWQSPLKEAMNPLSIHQGRQLAVNHGSYLEVGGSADSRSVCWWAWTWRPRTSLSLIRPCRRWLASRLSPLLLFLRNVSDKKKKDLKGKVK